jgi:hypothetical protein
MLHTIHEIQHVYVIGLSSRANWAEAGVVELWGDVREIHSGVQPRLHQSVVRQNSPLNFLEVANLELSTFS